MLPTPKASRAASAHQLYIEYHLGGSFAPNFSRKLATTTDPKQVPLDPWCYAFRFLKLTTPRVPQTGPLSLGPKVSLDPGPLYFPDGIIYSQAEIRHQLPDTQGLLENMQHNHWEFVVKTRLGYYRPFGAKDQVFATTKLQTTSPVRAL